MDHLKFFADTTIFLVSENVWLKDGLDVLSQVCLQSYTILLNLYEYIEKLWEI